MLTKLSNYSKSIKYYNLFIYLTIGLSSVTLFGWIFNIEILKSWDVDGKWLKMPVISALVFIIASVSLKLSIDNKFKSLSYYLPLLIFGIAIFSYLNYYYFNDYSNVAVYDLSIFVVQPLTVLAFSLIGIDLLLISFKNKKFQLIIEIIASIGLLLNFIFFITMLFGIKSIGNIIFFPKVSFQGTICLILISFSILSSSPNKILLSVYNYNSNAARVVIVFNIFS